MSHALPCKSALIVEPILSSSYHTFKEDTCKLVHFRKWTFQSDSYIFSFSEL